LRVHLVQSASGIDAGSWKGAGGSRPLSEQGRAEAVGLVDFLRGRSIERLISAPAQRCRDTLALLAKERELPIHVDDRFEDGAPLQPALRLLRSLDAPTLVCVDRAQLLALLAGLLGGATSPEGWPSAASPARAG
jgi:phosphohistidine phosphatase SixA